MAGMKTLPQMGNKGENSPLGGTWGGGEFNTNGSMFPQKNARKAFTKAQTESFPKGPVNNMGNVSSKLYTTGEQQKTLP